MLIKGSLKFLRKAICAVSPSYVDVYQSEKYVALRTALRALPVALLAA
jgi:hypothetical protein